MARKVVCLLAIIAASPLVGAGTINEAPVNKVISMLEDLQTQVMDEGKKEAATYDLFQCYCKDNTADTNTDIQKEEDEVTKTQSVIETLGVETAELDEKIPEINEDIKDAEDSKAYAKHENEQALALYARNSADVKAAISSVQEAVRFLKSSTKSGSASLLEVQSVTKTINTALTLADALGLSSAVRTGQILLQASQPEVEMENYKSHSGDIIEQLETLVTDFRAQKNDLDADEAKRKQTYRMAMQSSAALIQTKTTQLENTQQGKDEKLEDTAKENEDLKVENDLLHNDQEYLAKLADSCAAKAETFELRSKARLQELTALTQAIDIMKSTLTKPAGLAQVSSSIHIADAVANDEDAMMALEAEAESTEAVTPMTFLQRRQTFAAKHQAPSSTSDSKQTVVSLLKSRGLELNSPTLLHLASQLSADPFAKIKQLITELVERSLQEASEEANHKGWCDKALSDAEQKRDHASEKVEKLNAEMGKLESKKSKLAEELAVLSHEIASLTESKDEAEKMRDQEKQENKESLSEARQGLEATQKAISILADLYKTAANVQASAKASLSQVSSHDDGLAAPDAGFEAGEAYQSGQGSAGGKIVGMLEVLESDFRSTIKETEASEEEAAKEHLELITETEKSIGEKEVATGEKSRQKDETEEALSSAGESLKAQSTVLSTAITELLDLQPPCVNTGGSYEDRVAKREQEIESLQKALGLLNEQ